MKTDRLLTATLAFTAIFAALNTQPSVSAQGRAGGAVAAAPVSDAQLTALAQAVTTARTAVATASFADPRNDADVRTKIDVLRTAELAQATLLSDQFQQQVSGLIQAGLRAGKAGGRGGRGGGGGGGGNSAPPADDLSEFNSIFDGKSLANWEGDPRVWRAESGMIIGETTANVVISDNTFLAWRGGVLKDFELKIETRLATGNGNSGIQVRSKMMTAATGRSGGEPRPWGMGGYQVEVAVPGSSAASGTLLEERDGMRGFLSVIGQVLRKLPNRESKLMGNLGENLPAVGKPPGEWNAFHIIALGPQITVILNGRTTQIVIDEDTQLRALDVCWDCKCTPAPRFEWSFGIST